MPNWTEIGGFWLSLVSFVVSTILTIIIIVKLQVKLENERFLKEYVIEEIKAVKAEYKDFFSNLYQGETNPRTLLSWFKVMNTRVRDLETLINECYGIEDLTLTPYKLQVRNIITESEEFGEQFNNNELLLEVNTINKLIRFQQINERLFNGLVIQINKSKRR